MQKRSGVRRVGTGRTRKRAALGLREKRRLLQLGLCLGLFLVVFLGKGVAPAGVLHSGEKLLQTIHSDTDFVGAFSAMGEAISQGEPFLDALKRLTTGIFGAGERTEGEGSVTETVISGPATRAAAEALTRRPTKETMLERLSITVNAEETDGGGEAEQDPQPQPVPTPEPTPEIPAYTGPALPEGATMEYVALGLENVVTPVMGEVSSAFGYRDHPVNGEYSFHTGVDVAADAGTPVAAFADGTVDFIGESEAYGLYIQLDHGNGVTTFYCHCSDLYAQKGNTVTAGQTIATVGDTGNATGPHLHLELEQNEVLLNPAYYIETAG